MGKKKDNVNHPEHYTRGGIECIDAIEASMEPAQFLGYLKGNALKYLWRYEDKGGIEDLEKCQWYVKKLKKKEKKLRKEAQEAMADLFSDVLMSATFGNIFEYCDSCEDKEESNEG